jgi:hypothetical protein
VSTTVTVWQQVALLPLASAASHVRVAAKELPHKPLVTVLIMGTIGEFRDAFCN